MLYIFDYGCRCKLERWITLLYMKGGGEYYSVNKQSYWHKFPHRYILNTGQVIVSCDNLWPGSSQKTMV